MADNVADVGCGVGERECGASSGGFTAPLKSSQQAPGIRMNEGGVKVTSKIQKIHLTHNNDSSTTAVPDKSRQ